MRSICFLVLYESLWSGKCKVTLKALALCILPHIRKSVREECGSESREISLSLKMEIPSPSTGTCNKSLRRQILDHRGKIHPEHPALSQMAAVYARRVTITASSPEQSSTHQTIHSLHLPQKTQQEVAICSHQKPDKQETKTHPYYYFRRF